MTDVSELRKPRFSIYFFDEIGHAPQTRSHTPETMDIDNDFPPALLDHDGRFRGSEPPPLHLFGEKFGSGSARVGEEDFAFRREKLRDEVREIPGVYSLVQNIRREDEIELSETVEFRVSPVEKRGFQALSGVRLGVV